MSKHTPGPWKADVETTQVSGVHLSFCISSDSRIAIARGQSQEHIGADGIWCGEMTANARLIAAAPCMFAELIRLRNKLTAYMESEGFIYGEAADDIKSIDAILTKAGGEQ